jgi:hypothetical protein
MRPARNQTEVDMKTLSLSLLATLAATSALAHPEHVADLGHGHSHWLALAIFAGLAGAGVALWMRRRILAARRAQSAER